MRKVPLFFILLLALTSACSRPSDENASIQASVQAAVAATLTALPTATPPPTPTHPPTAAPPTPNLHNLFCEYDFCIGHPAETYLFDALMVKDTRTASNYAYGILMTYQPNLFVQIDWRLKSGEANPYDMLAVTAGDDVIDMNNVDVLQIGTWVVTTAPILKTASPNVLPYGLAAAWDCGDREFGWKTYAVSESQLPGLLQDALSRFHCQQETLLSP